MPLNIKGSTQPKKILIPFLEGRKSKVYEVVWQTILTPSLFFSLL
jgi:hypothetical protein